MNRCLAQDVPSTAEVTALLGGVDGLLYVMEYMEHGNFNVMSHSPLSYGDMKGPFGMEDPPIPRTPNEPLGLFKQSREC